MTTLVINSIESLQRACGVIRQMFEESKFLRLNAKVGKDRSPDQNAISHVWYEQAARELREEDALGWKCFCKLNFGVPILRAEDAEFREFYDASIKPALSYEQKLAAMKYLPVTSTMTKPQLSKYLEAMQAHFRTRGVLLEFPEQS